jgi:hypothetical protein
MATLKSYLTSLEPDMSQTIYSQSIGGYCSNSLLYLETTLAYTIGLYDTSISLNIPSSGNWLEWQGITYINIGNEMIQVSPMTNGSVTVVERGYNGIINMHIAGDDVRASSSKELFNTVLNSDHKQYRCIAIKNDSLSSGDPSDERIAYAVAIFLQQNSRSDSSTIRITLEQPTSQYITGISTSWNTMQIIDTSLIGVYNDNHFKEAYLRIISGGGADDQGKIVNSFDSSTGTFTFYNSFSSSYDYTVNVEYEVLPSPAQRIKTGTVSPEDAIINVLPFSSTSNSSPLRFTSGNASVPMVSDLYPNDVIYVWLERTIEKGVENFDHNDIVLNISYKTSE